METNNSHEPIYFNNIVLQRGKRHWTIICENRRIGIKEQSVMLNVGIDRIENIIKKTTALSKGKCLIDFTLFDGREQNDASSQLPPIRIWRRRRYIFKVIVTINERCAHVLSFIFMSQQTSRDCRFAGSPISKKIEDPFSRISDGNFFILAWGYPYGFFKMPETSL